MNESTFIFIKPDVFERNVEANVVNSIKKLVEEYNLKIDFEYEGVLTKHFLAYHYAVHLDKPFYEELIKDLEDKPFHAFIISGEDAVNVGLNRIKMIIRGVYAIDKVQNSLHSSDRTLTAKYEIDNFCRFYK